MTQLRIPAVYMRGGTSKGVFFMADNLPADPAVRDRILLRVIGSPDPCGKHIDGMGGATSSTSKVVLISKSSQADCDVDYLFGGLAVDKPTIDWSGNCGNLTAVVGPYAISFPAAEIRLEFIDPGAGEGEEGAMLPTGHVVDWLDVPGVGRYEATLINAGLPTIFVAAESLGFKGTELQPDINPHPEILARIEKIRNYGAVAMGLAATPEEAARTAHTPKVSFVARSQTYTASDGRVVRKEDIDILARVFSMGPLHHAMTGTGAVAIAAAVAIPGTLPNLLAEKQPDGRVRFGHPSGTLSVGAQAKEVNGEWVIGKAMMSRSARRLMEGWVRIPDPS